ITSHANPVDLLYLARSCKALRGILMKRSSIQMWRAAENNVLGLPNCPEDIAAPFYAALAFTKDCTVSTVVAFKPISINL
ncbi:hypothetical protein BDV93DRAFT_444044, partial [Ceratobasidium sp. AG-I]